MRILEDHPFGSQAIHVRRFGRWVALQPASPVIQILNGDKSSIRFSVLAGGTFPFAVGAHYPKQQN